MPKDAKKSEDYHYNHSEALKHWRAWGSWYSWGSPVGLMLGWLIFAMGFAIFVCALKWTGLMQ